MDGKVSKINILDAEFNQIHHRELIQLFKRKKAKDYLQLHPTIAFFFARPL